MDWIFIGVGIVVVAIIIAIILIRRIFARARQTTELFIPEDEIETERQQWTETTTLEQQAAATVKGPTWVEGFELGDTSIHNGWRIRITGEEDRELADRLATDILMKFLEVQEEEGVEQARDEDVEAQT